MLSRVADHQYWMARQMERAENLARLVRVSEEMLLDDESLGRGTAQEYWTPVLAATAMESSFRVLYPEPKQGDVARFLTLDLRNPDSILSCIRLARENARSVRDKISDEMWSEINALNLFVTSPEGLELLERFPQAYYEKIISSSMLFDGITDATLTRDEGWNFLQLGRLLERADMTSRFLDIRSQTLLADGDSALESLQWGAVLRACSVWPPASRTAARRPLRRLRRSPRQRRNRRAGSVACASGPHDTSSPRPRHRGGVGRGRCNGDPPYAVITPFLTEASRVGANPGRCTGRC